MSISSFELKPQVVRAGAGAGKTFNLTHHVLDVVKEFKKKNERYPRIITTTFTRKATQELKERLILMATEDRSEVGGESQELIEYFSGGHDLLISTIHGILYQFLNQYGYLAQLEPNFSFISPRNQKRLAKKILRQVTIENEEYSEICEQLSFGALSSYLSEMVGFYLQHSGFAPFSMEELRGHTSELLREMHKVLESLILDIPQETSNGKWLELRDWYQRLLQMTTWTWGEFYEGVHSLEKKPVARKSGKGYEISHDLLERKQWVDDQLKDIQKVESYNPEKWNEFNKKYQVLQSLFKDFKDQFLDYKIESGLISMADLEELTLFCLKESPEAGRAFSQEWDYWLIDEYQDTSPTQVEILKHLVGDKPSYTVGDPQQSIYLFRGARSEVFENRLEAVTASGGQCEDLQKNYRSIPELLEFFNTLFSNYHTPFRTMEHHLPDPSYVVDKSKVVATFLDCEESEKGDIYSQENLGVLNYIVGLLQKGVQPEDICVLGRTRKNLVQVAGLLQQAEIPHQVYISSGFFQRREVLDGLFLLRYLINPYDNKNLVGLLRSPWAKFSDETLIARAEGPYKNLWRSLEQARVEGLLSTDEVRVMELLERIVEVSQKKGVISAFESFLVESAMIDSSHYIDSSGRREANIWKLLSMIKAGEKKPGFNILEFIENALDGSFEEDESDAVAAIEPRRLSLMTIHASKGLQFDHVIVLGMGKAFNLTKAQDLVVDEASGKWGISLPIGENGKKIQPLPGILLTREMRLEEELEADRLFYVAVTRAKCSICFSWEKESPMSWILRIGMDLSEGVHEKDLFSYEVTKKKWKFVHFEGDEFQEKTEVFRSLDLSPSQNAKIWSTTELVERIGHHQKIEFPEPRTKSHFGEELQRVSEKISFGVLSHRLFEALKYSGFAGIEEYIGHWFPEQKSQVASALSYLRQLQEFDVESVMDSGAAEWGFKIRRPLALDGQVDLWGRDLNTGILWVIDYKSGNTRYVEKAMTQLEIYSLALRICGKSSRGEEIRIAAVFPFEKKIFSRPARTYDQLMESFKGIDGLIVD